MDVFKLRDELIGDYSTYIKSFIQINDQRIRDRVDKDLDNGLLWPDPLVQINPNYEPGGSIDDLVEHEILHNLCGKIFRRGKTETDFGKPLNLHKHQSEAIITAQKGENYILTTGTGSGKSLSYIIPIVDYILKHPEQKGSIKAIIVYPMNALANSQLGELDKFLKYGLGGKEAVTYRRYTGQESPEERNEISKNPPDIILTNYVMLELLLTRTKNDKKILKAAQGLRFLVLDELHTYRGRQGADIGMLVRRTREILNARNLQCIGTSATMSSDGTIIDQKRQIVAVANTIFGTEFKQDNIIGETLRRVTKAYDFRDPAALSNLRSAVLSENTPSSFEAFIENPLAAWIEDTIGIKMDDDSGTYVRAYARPLSGKNGIAKDLAQVTDISENTCEGALQRMLIAGYNVENPATGIKAFVFRLHQFISRGDTVYASLESEAERYITTNGQHYVPGSNQQKVLFPMAFCRECGQPFYTVKKDPERGRENYYIPQALGDGPDGFIYYNESDPWPEDYDEIVRRIPDDWVDGDGKIKQSYRKYLPQTIDISPAGEVGGNGIHAAYFPSLFHFCPHCGTVYTRPRTNYPALATLSAGGRSTDTTLLSYSLLTQLKDDPDLDPSAQKLLSFTDNRQDASLQAGHFNDFMDTVVLRIAIFNAIREFPEGLRDEKIAEEVYNALDMEFAQFAKSPNEKFSAKNETISALKSVLRYRIYTDLRRGWRLTSPNLEQCGLLRVEYLDLQEIAADEETWQNRHIALAVASPETREELLKVLLDFMRRELAINADCLTLNGFDRIRLKSDQKLIYPWALEEDAKTARLSCMFFPHRKPDNQKSQEGNKYIGPRSNYANYLNKVLDITMDDREEVIQDIFNVIAELGLAERVGNEDDPGYQIKASSLIWLAADGSEAFSDPLRRKNITGASGRTNKFFVDFYQQTDLHKLLKLRAHEHTAQVSPDERQKREADFRSGALPLLFCSPTMEVGVDISQLNAVNMRNVPPTPANYAQRSGRAGRSGQPALVFTYCTIGSPHDQYYFKRQQDMVSGHVSPPRIDMSNQDMLRSHVQALWLYNAGVDLGTKMPDVIDHHDTDKLPLMQNITDALQNQAYRNQTISMANHILKEMQDTLNESPWWSESWLENVCGQVEKNFEQACQRWRMLYKSARDQKERQDRITLDNSREKKARDIAKTLSNQAYQQMIALESSEGVNSDFYPYRYFASEGFLPGYSFPRLPVSAYIPGTKDEGTYLQRPRFLAVSEFGPQAYIYHEGNRYQISRVNLPYSDTDGGNALIDCKICPKCGYIHEVDPSAPIDTCENCGSPLPETFNGLFRMTSVVTRRKDHITSDEEERMRLSYNLKTGYHWDKDKYGNPMTVFAEINPEGEDHSAELTYGQNAALWRINLGWRSREEEGIGFDLDMERGYWVKRNRDNNTDDNDQEEPYSSRIERVVPFVEDHKNSLLFKPNEPLSEEQMISLSAALRRAIQTEYQLEDGELASELLPAGDGAYQILFYESAEGGAGVLRRLAEEKDAFAKVAKTALEICHFNPETGEDRGHAEHSTEHCEAACYDCLMSYSNQHDHLKLNRFGIRDILLSFAYAETRTSSVSEPRDEHFKKLLEDCESDLERKWLKFIDDHDLPLPEEGQHLISDPMTRTDFFYARKNTVIYVDGPQHDIPQQQAKDEDLREELEDSGYLVIVFRYDDDWDKIIADNPSVFGRM